MKNIKKAVPILASALTAGAVAWGAAASLGRYVQPVYGADEFQIAQSERQAPTAEPVRENVSEEGQKAPDDAPKSSQGETAAQGSFDLADGDYPGTGTGFRGPVKVSVNIREKKIASIDVLSHSDDEAFFNRAKEGVIGKILSAQSLEVDAVSGATYSSAGILEAVRDALSKAAVSQEKKPRPTAAPKKTPTPAKTPPAQTPAAPSGKFPYPDGIYQGVGEGFGGDIAVTVAIQNKAIREIQVTSHEGEDEAFFNRAKAVLAQVVQKQDIQVDAVSGATYSSRGILEGIAQAIEAAKKAAAGITPAPKPTETPKPIETPTGTPIPSETPAPETPGGLLYIDGEYTASALCLPDAYEDFAPYNLTLTLAVQGDQITAIKGISGDGGRENESYIKRAADGSAKYPGVVSQILERNSLEGVDAVSHATCSSQSILEACRQALEAAKKQPENGGEE